MSESNGMQQNFFLTDQYLGEELKKKGIREFSELRAQSKESIHVFPGQTKTIETGFRAELKTGYHAVVYPSEWAIKKKLTFSGMNNTANGINLLLKNNWEDVKSGDGIGVQGFQSTRLGDELPKEKGPGRQGVCEINQGALVGYLVYEKNITHNPARRKRFH